MKQEGIYYEAGPQLGAKLLIVMTYVVTESCIKCKYTDCVDVCPVEAIFAEDDVPDAQREFIALNKELAQKWQPLIERKPAPADADDWAKKKEKKNLLER